MIVSPYMRIIVVHTDGASRGNPGPAAAAYVIEGLTPEPIEYAKTIGQTSNNQAEYQAMVAAMEKLSLEISEPVVINCFADSELMIKQLNGDYRVKDALLKPHYQKIIELSSQLSRRNCPVEFTAIRREQNKRADQLANMALDGKLD